MKWYSTILVLECRIGKNAPKLWDSQIRVIRAKNPEQAYLVARQIGKSDETKYKNSEGEVVSWKFVGIGELSEILSNNIRSGVEVYSSLTRGKLSPKVLSKQQLNVFWYERNRDKTAGELLSLKPKRFAPK